MIFLRFQVTKARELLLIPQALGCLDAHQLLRREQRLTQAALGLGPADA